MIKSVFSDSLTHSIANMCVLVIPRSMVGMTGFGRLGSCSKGSILALTDGVGTTSLLVVDNLSSISILFHTKLHPPMCVGIHSVGPHDNSHVCKQKNKNFKFVWSLPLAMWYASGRRPHKRLQLFQLDTTIS